MGICVSEHGYLRVKPWVSVKTVRDQGHSKMYHNDLPLEARFHRAKNIECTSRPFTAANELPVARRPEVTSTSGSAYVRVRLASNAYGLSVDLIVGLEGLYCGRNMAKMTSYVAVKQHLYT